MSHRKARISGATTSIENSLIRSFCQLSHICSQTLR